MPPGASSAVQPRQPAPARRDRWLAVAFGPPTMAEALAQLPRLAADGADAVELRLDLFQEPFDLPRLLAACGSLPVVATLRPPDQGGRCPLPPEARLETLLRAAALGAAYVDLEWDAATPDAVRAVRAAGARVIVSRHDLAGMPAQLATGWWDTLAATGADVVKLVGLAADARDCLPVFHALRRADRPAIAIAMGEAGLPSRVLALREERCLLTYAALEDGGGTAPGQVTLRELRETYRADRLGARTAVFGVLGARPEPTWVVRANAWLAAAGLDAVGVPILAGADPAGVVQAFRALPVAGWAVQDPETQETVGQALDEIAPSACRSGRVNTILAVAGGGLVGAWAGSAEEQLDQWADALAGSSRT